MDTHNKPRFNAVKTQSSSLLVLPVADFAAWDASLSELKPTEFPAYHVIL